MTKSLRNALEIIFNQIKPPKSILEIGSLQTKNQRRITNLRPLFRLSKYIGIDMRNGLGVDIRSNAEKLPFPDKSFDLVICLETFEHLERPWIVVEEIKRVLSHNGVFVLSTQQNYPIHNHPADYFRYTPYGLSTLFNFLNKKIIISISPPFDNEVKLNPQCIILIGSMNVDAIDINKIKSAILRNKSFISTYKPKSHRLRDGLKFIKRGLLEAFYRQEFEFYL